MHTNLRDSSAWLDQGLPMNTGSNEACKLYDATLSQLYAYRENKEIGGFLASMNGMVDADPNFVLGKCLKLTLSEFGNSDIEFMPEQAKLELDELKSLAVKLGDTLSHRERMHVRAVDLMAKGDLPKAAQTWEQILIEHPTDPHAAKMAHRAYFDLGFKNETRDSVARILPRWKPCMPFYSNLYGMYAYGLTQTNELDKAEKMAMRGLEIYRHDAWSTHAISHVNEYSSTPEKGIRFLTDTEADWSVCDFLQSHNYWHLALFHFDKNEYEQAFQVMNEQLLSKNNLIDMVNVSSLLYRMKLDGRGDDNDDYFKAKWKTLRENINDRLYKHGFLYAEVHLALVMSSCGSSKDEKSTYLNSIESYTGKNGSSSEHESILSSASIDKELKLADLVQYNEPVMNYLRKINAELAIKLVKSVFAYDEGDYDQVVDLLYSIRHKIVKCGGSNAQMDIFHQLLLYSALKSSSEFYKKLGVALFHEREARRPNSNLNKRIAERFSII